MTIEQLLGYSADDLEKMSDVELTQHLAKYITHTRPLSKEEKKSATTSSQVISTAKKSRKPNYEEILEENKRRVKAISEQFGLKLEI